MMIKKELPYLQVLTLEESIEVGYSVQGEL